MKKIKINVEFELSLFKEVENSTYPDELLKNDLVEYLNHILKWDNNNELYIDLSDDGDGHYNIYEINIIN